MIQAQSSLSNLNKTENTFSPMLPDKQSRIKDSEQCWAKLCNPMQCYNSLKGQASGKRREEEKEETILRSRNARPSGRHLKIGFESQFLKLPDSCALNFYLTKSKFGRPNPDLVTQNTYLLPILDLVYQI